MTLASSETLMILLAVVAAVPPVASLLNLSVIGVFRLSDTRAEWVARAASWGYLFLIVILAAGALYTSSIERSIADRGAAARRREDARKIEELKGQLSALDNITRRNNQILQQIEKGRSVSAPAHTEAPHAPPSSHPSQPNSAAPKPTPTRPASEAPLEPLWAPVEDQVKILAGLIAQTPQAANGVWLSQIVVGLGHGRYDGVPPGDTVDFPKALRLLAQKHQVEIIATGKRHYRWGDWVFSDDIEFRTTK